MHWVTIPAAQQIEDVVVDAGRLTANGLHQIELGPSGVVKANRFPIHDGFIRKIS
jgi:hypothetical protein